MSIATSLVNDMNARLSLVRAQVTAGLDKELLLNGACDGFITSVTSMGGLNIESIEAVTRAVTASEFTSTHQHRIAVVLAAEQKSVGQSGATRKNQHCGNIEDFMTSAVWDRSLDKSKSLTFKLMSLATFVQGSLNISCPSIPLLKRLISILDGCHEGHDLATPQLKKDAAKKLQEFIKDGDRNRRPNGLPHIVHFPTDPLNLPGSIQSVAYADGGPAPCKLSPGGINENDVPYKKTHRSLVTQPMTTDRDVQWSPRDMQGMMFNMGHMLQAQMRGNAMQDEAGHRQPITIFDGGPSGSSNRRPPPLMAPPTPERHGASPNTPAGCVFPGGGGIAAPATPGMIERMSPGTPGIITSQAVTFERSNSATTDTSIGVASEGLDTGILRPDETAAGRGEDAIDELELKLLGTAAHEKKLRNEDQKVKRA